ncbi:MAG: aminotransferase class I/II-fold pyridoxal phosphate-dependent enzyme [Saprospirales bacterium]|nr:aminotransferase class I/II-fold pyridoxal phosphate-dependent enzyme [Saprospirales bacterium]
MSAKTNTAIREKYRRALAGRLGIAPEQIGLFWKGRVGLYAILRALGVRAGDEVILPAFTCVVVPNAILYLGAKPVYVDVDANTFNLETGLLEAAIRPQTKCILAQNTFGLSAELDPLLKIAQKYQIPVIEDCTHGFGGAYRGQANGTLTQASFFSTQWNKPFSTGWGGFTAIRDEALAREVQKLEEKMPMPSPGQERMLQLQIWTRKNLLTPALYWPVLRLYRRLSNMGVIPGSSEGSELHTTTMPKGYLLAGGEVQAHEGLLQLSRWERIQERRLEVAALYDQALEKLGLPRLFVPPHISHSYLKYPLLVKDRAAFFALAVRHRIRLGDWMRSPIHPVEENWEKWGYVPGACPTGEHLSRHVVNLLTDLDLTEKEIQRTVAFLDRYREEIFESPGHY